MFVVGFLFCVCPFGTVHCVGWVGLDGVFLCTWFSWRKTIFIFILYHLACFCLFVEANLDDSNKDINWSDAIGLNVLENELRTSHALTGLHCFGFYF